MITKIFHRYILDKGERGENYQPKFKKVKQMKTHILQSKAHMPMYGKRKLMKGKPTSEMGEELSEKKEGEKS